MAQIAQMIMNRHIQYKKMTRVSISIFQIRNNKKLTKIDCVIWLKMQTKKIAIKIVETNNLHLTKEKLP